MYYMPYAFLVPTIISDRQDVIINKLLILYSP